MGPNSAPNGDAGLVRGHKNEEFVCVLDKKKHTCGDAECKLISLRLTGVRTGKTAKKRG